MQYASAEELQEWMGAAEVSPRASVVLRSASWLVRAATAGDRYPVDAAGLPSAVATIEAFRDATLSHAAFWLANDIDPGKGLAGIPRPITSKGQLGTSISYGESGQTGALSASISELVPEAKAILRASGLMSSRIGRSVAVSAHIVTSPVFP